MATYDHDLQAAVDATSVAKDSGETDDLAAYLREQLAEREIETTDDDWIAATVQGIRNDPNFMVADQPRDYEPADRPHQP